MPRPQITRLLDRPGGRTLLGLAASAYLTGKERRLCVVHRSGGAWVHRHGKRSVVESKIALAPPEELDRRVAEAFLHTYDVKAGDVVVDIGSGVGRETVMLARRVGPSGRVISVEAFPSTFAMLEAAVARNRLTNVTAVQAAIGAEDGHVQLVQLDEHTHNRIDADGAGGGAISVPALKMVSLLETCGVDRVDFLKMNIEGAEGPSLVAMGPDLTRIAHAAISCHDFVVELFDGDESYRTVDTVTECMEGQGFTIERRLDDPRPYIRDTIYATGPA